MERYDESYGYYGHGGDNGDGSENHVAEEDCGTNSRSSWGRGDYNNHYGNTGEMPVSSHHNNDASGGGSSRRHHDESHKSSSSGGRRDGRDRRERHRDRSESNSHRKERRRSGSRSRSRSRDRDRSSRHDKRRKEKRRHRRRSSSRSTKSRSRSRSRSSDRRRHRRRRRHRSSSRHSSDEYSDYHGDYRQDYKTQYDSYKYQEPNSTIMVRGLALHLNENDIRQDVLRCGIMVKDIRLIRNRDTGASRGFAFVEFNSVADATRWMDLKKGLLVLHDQFQANLIYSIPKVPTSEGVSKLVADWFCERCHGHNFKRREFCYKCNAPRPEDQDGDLYDEISSHPTSMIILSNLDTLTTEEGVLQAFQSKPSMACIPIKNVKVAREPGTCLSRGVCYVEANNVSEASRLFMVFSQEALEIDGRIVSAAYGKSANPATLLKNSNAAAAALAAAQWTNSSSTPTGSVGTGPPCTEVKTEADIEKMAQYCAQLYAKTPEDYASYLDYYRQYYQQEVAKGSSQDAAVLKAGPSTSSSQHTQQHHHQSHQPSHPVVAASGSHSSLGWADNQDTGTQSGVPDTSRYQYDETSGYYFDPASGLYYDSNTQYFYDAEKQQFLHWSPEDKKYVAVSGNSDGDCSEKADILNGDGGRRKGKKSEKSDKVKVAKRIAKEMEKWAKTLNQKKDAIRQVPIQASIAMSSSTMPSGLASGSSSYMSASSSTAVQSGRNILDQEYVYTAAENLTTYQPATAIVENIRQTNSDYDSGSEEDKVEFNSSSNEASLVDESKLACLLCKRRFASMEVLQKHIKMSDLHKKNLEALRNSSDGAPGSSSYRDRAKERRDRFGFDKDVGKNTLKDLYLQAKKDLTTSYVEEPTKDGIRDDNIGNRMLQKMGWHEGQGLGRDNQGRVDIIMAERRSGKHGLGIRGAEPIDDKLDPQTKARKLTLARYQELN